MSEGSNGKKGRRVIRKINDQGYKREKGGGGKREERG